MTFREALDHLLWCHRRAPFCFNNGNTFAAIARDLIVEVNPKASVAGVLRSVARHYVAGVLRIEELLAVLGAVEVPDN
jgi:hypothetical protein